MERLLEVKASFLDDALMKCPSNVFFETEIGLYPSAVESNANQSARRDSPHTGNSLTPPETDQIKSSTRLAAAVCLVFAANFTAIYW